MREGLERVLAVVRTHAARADAAEGQLAWLGLGLASGLGLGLGLGSGLGIGLGLGLRLRLGLGLGLGSPLAICIRQSLMLRAPDVVR